MAAPNVSKIIPVDCDASAVAAVAACDDDGTTTRPVRSGEIDTTQFDQAKARVEQKAASLKVSEVTRKLEQAKRAGRRARHMMSGPPLLLGLACEVRDDDKRVTT